jgi:DNA-binding NtrC family response regulator
MEVEQILVVDDHAEVLEYLSDLLGQSGYRVTACGDATSALSAIEREGQNIGLAIVDLDLGYGSDDGLKLLSDIKQRQSDLPVIILTAQGGTRMAVQAMKLGAVDFLEKDTYLLTNLTARMKRASEFLKIVRENRRLRSETESLRRTAEYYRELAGRQRVLVGKSAALRTCLSEAEMVARANRPVLIRGDRGTGKELVAEYIHAKSQRAGGPFIAVNCAAFGGSLLESEMFGHEKGAFTGSAGRKAGRFELADGGTLFLDEIGNMSKDFQEMILRVVEYQRFERVQGTETLEVDARILAATNADMESMMDRGEFRRDLYDRLAFKEIHVPALFDRREDIPELVEHFLGLLRHDVPSTGDKRFTSRALSRLATMNWPGNVRQLRNTVERLALETRGEEIDEASVSCGRENAHAEASDFDGKVEAFQRGLLERALSQCGGNQTEAAQCLGLTYDQFRHYYRKFASQRSAEKTVDTDR